MRRSKFLTARQRVVFDFVRQRIYEGLPPSLREIGAHFGFTGANAFQVLNAIAKKGYIRIEADKARSIFLLPPYKDDTRHSFVVDADIPQLNIQKGDYLLIDAGKPAAEGDVILSDQGEIKRFAVGDVAFGKVTDLSRPID